MSRSLDPDTPATPNIPRLAGHWLPPMAVAVAASASAMGLAGIVPAPVDQLAAFMLGLVATALIGLVAGVVPALVGVATCALWVWSPWLSPSLPGLSFAAVLFVAVGLATALGAARIGRERAAPFETHAAAPGPSAEPVTIGTPALSAGTGASASERGLLVLIGLAIVLPFALYAVLGWYVWQSTQRETSLRLDRIARAAQEHASKVMDTNEMLLGRVQDLVGKLRDDELAAQEKALHTRLVQLTGSLPQVLSIWVHSAAGRPLVISPAYPAPAATLDVSDRDFFVWHRENRGGLYVSQPAVAG